MCFVMPGGPGEDQLMNFVAEYNKKIYNTNEVISGWVVGEAESREGRIYDFFLSYQVPAVGDRNDAGDAGDPFCCNRQARDRYEQPVSQ
jgi:hypothetical protein